MARYNSLTGGIVMNISEIESVCKLLSESFKLPIVCINKTNDVVFEFVSSFPHNPIHHSLSDLLKETKRLENVSDVPVFFSTSFFEHFFTININNLKISVGPVLYSPMTEVKILGLLHDFNIGQRFQSEFQFYFDGLHVFEHLQFVHISLMFYHAFFQKVLNPWQVIQENASVNDLEGSNFLEERTLEEKLLMNRKTSFTHNDLLAEKKVMQCIKEGDVTGLETSTVHSLEDKYGVLSKTSNIRSLKNNAICGVALATRAAVDGGLDKETAFTMSDLYIQEIEDMQNVEGIRRYIPKVLKEFTGYVHRSKTETLSKPISTCRNYIMTNIYSILSVSKLADMVHLNPVYLSRLFKKEMGVSLSEYIQLQKIEEAKRLMRYSDDPLAEICTSLGFSDQSYFTKVFKKFTNITPTEFKKQFD
jgi:YSIRK-targeted surface antigen transcriptional regulator